VVALKNTYRPSNIHKPAYTGAEWLFKPALAK